MPTFCRHNRFVERCPICRQDAPGHSAGSAGRRGPSKGARGGTAANRSARSASSSASQQRGAVGGGGSHGRRARSHASEPMRVYGDGARRGREDGYRCALVPGLRSSEDSERLASEIAFAAARLTELSDQPPGLYGRARQLAHDGEIEAASWLCLLCAYLCPLEGPQPFEAIEAVWRQIPELDGAASSSGLRDDALDTAALGPRSCHEPGRGVSALRGYLAIAARVGSQREMLTGEPSWSPQRRFERLFERLAVPGLSRAMRFELLSTLGALGLYELAADSLHLVAAASAGDPVLAAAKRVFGIGDAVNLERRAAVLCDECGVPLQALDLAIFNWAAPDAQARAGMAARSAVREQPALASARAALGL